MQLKIKINVSIIMYIMLVKEFKLNNKPKKRFIHVQLKPVNVVKFSFNEFCFTNTGLSLFRQTITPMSNHLYKRHKVCTHIFLIINFQAESSPDRTRDDGRERPLLPAYRSTHLTLHQMRKTLSAAGWLVCFVSTSNLTFHHWFLWAV
jgi:hypothetical protein